MNCMGCGTPIETGVICGKCMNNQERAFFDAAFKAKEEQKKSLVEAIEHFIEFCGEKNLAGDWSLVINQGSVESTTTLILEFANKYIYD